jgi:hypothetical protein
MKKVLKRTAIVLICLVALWCILLALRRPWIEPVPGVRLEPTRPILLEKDVKPGSAFDLMRQATATFTWDQFREGKALDEWDRKPWSLEGATNTLALLEQAQASLTLARRAAQASGPQVPTVTSLYQKKPYLAKTRAITRCFNLSAKTKTVREDYSGAFADLKTAIGFASILTRGSGLIECLVNRACCGISCKTMRQIALNYPAQDAVLQETMRFLEETENGLEPWAECMRHECIFMRLCVDEFFRNPSSLTELISLGSSGSSRDQALRIIAPFVGSTSSIMKKDMDACFTHFVSMAGKPYDEETYDRFYELLRPVYAFRVPFLFILTSRDPIGRMLAGLMLPAIGPAHARHDFMITNLRATRIVLAVVMFKRAEGRLPQKLDELVPKYLDKVPDDPFDGKQMKYRVDAAGIWVVYSVSRDKKDDGGVKDREQGIGKPDLVFGPTEEK